jgi:hypothetical protein
MNHPWPVNTLVRHVNQEWARSIPTARIIEVHGPYADGTFEYKVLAARRFSERPSPSNPMDRETMWSSNAVIAVTAATT